MINKPFTSWDRNQAAAELINQNVSFDFQAFLRKVGPAPSRVVLKHESDERIRAEKQAQNNLQDRPENGRG